MSCTNHKMIIQPVGYMELLQGHFAAFLYFCLVFTVLGVLNLIGIACTTSFKFHFNAQVPMLIELVVASQHKTGNRNGVTFKVAVSLSRSVKSVDTVVLKLSQNLAITAHTITAVAIHLSRIVVPLGVGVSSNRKLKIEN